MAVHLWVLHAWPRYMLRECLAMCSMRSCRMESRRPCWLPSPRPIEEAAHTGPCPIHPQDPQASLARALQPGEAQGRHKVRLSEGLPLAVCEVHSSPPRSCPQTLEPRDKLVPRGDEPVSCPSGWQLIPAPGCSGNGRGAHVDLIHHYFTEVRERGKRVTHFCR